MIGVPECNRIQKDLRVGVAESNGPARAAVDGLINPRFLSFAYGKQKRLQAVEGVDVAKIEVRGARNDARSPGDPAVDGANECAAGATGPHHVVAHNTQAAQPRVCAAFQARPLGPCGASEQGNRRNDEQCDRRPLAEGKVGHESPLDSFDPYCDDRSVRRQLSQWNADGPRR